MLLLRIQDVGTNGYPLELFVSNEHGSWPDAPIARELIPADLDVAAASCTHGAMDANAIRDFMLATSDASDHFLCIGKYLFGLLARGDLGARWKRERTNGASSLLHIEPDQLRRLPWELMVDGAMRLFLQDPPISRVINPQPSASEPLELPVRLLVIVGAGPDAPGVLAEHEVIAIRRALGELNGEIDPVLLMQPDKPTLARELRDLKPHVIHFIGHAVRHDDKTALKIEVAGAGATWYWTLDQMLAHITAPAPRLVILNACRTADANPPTGDAAATHGSVWNITERLVREAGVHAVVGMQADIAGDAAVNFAGGLYKAIGAGTSIDQAVSSARKAIENHSELLRREWALPCLVAASKPEPLLAIASVDQTAWNSITASPEFAELDRFVDRDLQRSGLRDALHPPGIVPARHSPFVILMSSAETTDDEKYGKTELAKWCLRQCLFIGMEVRYVDLQCADPMSLLEMLDRIRRGAGDGSPVSGPITGVTIDDIDLSPSPPEIPSSTDLGRIIRTFRAGLIEVANGRPFVLVLDHLSGLAIDALRVLGDHIEGLVGGTAAAPVRLVLVSNGRTKKEKIPLSLALKATNIDVPEIDSALLEPLVVQYLCHLIDDHDKLHRVAKAFAAMERDLHEGKSWRPGRLKKVLK